MIIEEPKLSIDRHRGFKMETKMGTGGAAQKMERGWWVLAANVRRGGSDIYNVTYEMNSMYYIWE